MSMIELLMLAYFVCAAVLKVDSWIPTAAALLLLIYCPIVWIQKGEFFANQIAAYAFYFLLIGVSLALLEYVRLGRTTNEEHDGSN
jgi:hypothetical protein